MINSRNINDLKPYVRYLAEKLIKESEKIGLKVLITSTLRDAEYQQYLYSLGRSRKGNIVTRAKLLSSHGFGLAFDICQNIKGREWEDEFFNKVSKIGMSLGLEWGGNWKTICDKPHFQFTGGLSDKQLREGMMPHFPIIPQNKPVPAPPIKEVNNMFNDFKLVSDYAKPTVEKLGKLGLFKGDENNNFNPDKPITREEFAIVIDRILTYIGR